MVPEHYLNPALFKTASQFIIYEVAQSLIKKIRFGGLTESKHSLTEVSESDKLFELLA